MIGGGRGAFIGAVHRMAARLDDRYELVAGALSANAERARASGADLFLSPERTYTSVTELIRMELARSDRIDVVAIVTPNHVHYSAARECLAAGIHVICDKPLTINIEEAVELLEIEKRTQRVLAVTYNYSGYPLVRHARELIARKALGRIRVAQVEYAQGWLARKLEANGDKQALWRTDPERAGVAGAVADIGSHAFQLVEFVTGLQVSHVAADLSSHVDGRRLDDNAQMMLRFEDGARGALWTSQVAIGCENGLRLRVYGDQAGLEWSQESPDQLRLTRVGEPPSIITRGSPGASESAIAATRLPPGHPEGYIEAFAQLYRDIADLIAATEAGASPSDHLVPTGKDGCRGVRFIHAAVRSSQHDSAWIAV